jgi:hypothetical protein
MLPNYLIKCSRNGKNLKRDLVMIEIKSLLQKQAEWQRSRAALSWTDKLRASLAMRKSLQSFGRPGIGQRQSPAMSRFKNRSAIRDKEKERTP